MNGTTRAAYRDTLERQLRLVQRAELNRPDFNPGMASEAFYEYVTTDLTEAGVDLDDTERRYLRWLTKSDIPTIAALVPLMWQATK